MTEEERWAKGLTVQRVIWASLLQGAGLFVAVALFSGLRFGVKNVDGILSTIAVAVGAVGLAASFVLPPAVSKAAALKLPSHPPAATLVGMWTTESILGWALIEGGALFCGVAYLIEKFPWAGAAAGVLLAALAARFPSWARRDAFLRRIGQGGELPAPVPQDDQLDRLRPRGE